ncbi:MAG TPA: PKD domain-containing protein [Chitinophagaceae bacterium]|nr:PKD domain-containing protein [Chitinophagaceae bacterium]
MRPRVFAAFIVLIGAMPGAVAQPDTAVISVQLKDNQASFNSVLRPLRQIAGAPAAFYSYYWEFGDGSFSFEEKPRHVFRDTGAYEIRLFATNNYDDGKPPPIKRPKAVYVSNKSVNVQPRPSGFFKEPGSLAMKVNRMPRPDEDLVLIMGYRNEAGTAASGSLLLFYNERQFRKDNFDFGEDRVYNNESRTTLSAVIARAPANELLETTRQPVISGPSGTEDRELNPGFAGRFSELITSRQKLFRESAAWRFSGLDKGEEKFFFITLHTTPEMIRDTNAVVLITGMFVPDDPNAELEQVDLELQIVASHDPNRMMLRNQRLNYRFTDKKREMTYKVRFQNTGRGPASNITVAVSVPPMLNPRSLDILEFYPRTIPCSAARPGQSCLDTVFTSDSIYFIFRNIYLPGLRQDGFSDIDSTQGFIRYRLQFNRELKKIPFESGAQITFDRNEPVRTNSARGHFMPGNSPSLMVGYSRLLGEQAKNNKEEHYFLAGAGWAPYAPHRKYLQVEAFLGYRRLRERFEGTTNENKDTVVNGSDALIRGRDIYGRPAIIKLELVPLQLRYNIMDWLGVGAGTQISMDAYTRVQYREVIRIVQPPNPNPFTIEKTYSQGQWFRRVDYSLFGDVQLGRVRVGPVVGVRFLHFFRFPHNRLFIYAGWRL